MVRVLCLPGWGTNTEVFNYQIAPLRKAFASDIEFVVLQGPVEVPLQPDTVLQQRFKGKFYSWHNTIRMKLSENKTEMLLVGLEQSLELIKKHLSSNPPYDGIMGFSQGGAIAAWVLALQNAGHLPGSFKFAVFVSPGFFPSENLSDYIPRDVPAVFLVGKEDIFMPLALLLARCFRQPKLLVHNEGHKFPRLTPEIVTMWRSLIETCKAQAKL